MEVCSRLKVAIDGSKFSRDKHIFNPCASMDQLNFHPCVFTILDKSRWINSILTAMEFGVWMRELDQFFHSARWLNEKKMEPYMKSSRYFIQ